MSETYIKPSITRHRKRRVWDLASDDSLKKPKVDVSQIQPTVGKTDTAEDGSFRRVYVGSINYMISQDLITELFKPFGVITRFEMPKQDPISGASKGYCFVEFSREQEALEALACMNGFAISGRPMKVGAPSGMSPPDVDYHEIFMRPHVQMKYDEVIQKASEMGVFTSRENALSMPSSSTGVAKPIPSNPENTVYVGSINYDLTADDVQSLFEAIGEVVHVHMIPNPETGKHKGYGFVTYASPDAAATAIATMHGMMVGDRSIVVSTVNKGQTVTPFTYSTMPMTDLTTNVVLLRNLITAEAYMKEHKEAFRGEIEEEMRNYGNVIEVRCKINGDEVDIFVQFDSNDAAARAKIALTGRVFDGRMMHLIKRDGRRESVMFEKITSRISRLCYGLNPQFVDPIVVSQKVCAGVYNGVTTTELDELAAETAANLSSTHPDYAILAARIAVSNLHKNTKKNFFDVMTDLYTYIDPKTDLPAALISDHVYDFIKENAEELNRVIIYNRDYTYDYFGFKTLERSYLLKLNGQVAERPQHMLMRVSCGIHYGNLPAAIETYNLLSEKWFTHASPTLFNAGTPRPQLSSCFLVTMKDDSIDGIYDTLKTCALISKQAGGIGLAVHDIRATGSYIRGTNGTSNGLVPMLRVFNNTARYVDQGGGKRKGAFAIYLEPWHADIFSFLDLRKNHGAEETRARDLFYGLWVSDLFMRRVESNGLWSLFCPNEAPGLADVWGEDFERLYERYERQGKARETVKARELWTAILTAQQETGTPYILYKDSCNRKSNQQNLGTIRSSNLCTEIVEYTAPDEVAVCNLASIALNRYVDEQNKVYDFKKLHQVTKVVTKNLNRIIDINYYPVPEAEYSNRRHRPIGLGVQGLADAFILLGLAYESEEAQQLNRDIFATIYHAALESSMELAKVDGPYETYAGSPVSKGQLQYDMWGVTPTTAGGFLDWPGLKANIAQHGVRNSLLVAPMPTASTSQILGNNESFEAYTSNLYVRRTLAGEFVCVNAHLLRDLVTRGIWSESLKNKLIANNGSVQNLEEIPADVREIYKTVWEMKGKTLVNMAADRGAYIDQSQSFNVHMANVNFAKLTSMHFYAWKKGLKTGVYYLRTKAAADAIKFTVDPAIVAQTAAQSNSMPPPAAPTANSTAKPAAATSTPNAKELQPNAVHLTPAAAARVPITPLKKEERVAEEEASIAAWRAEREKKKSEIMCALDNKEGCISCGS